MSADALSRARTPLGRQDRHMDASTPEVSRANALPARGAIVDRVFLWALIAGLAWCPFWFGSNVLFAWGVNAVLFPGLALLYEISLLVRGEYRQVDLWRLKIPIGLFVAVLAWIFVQNATSTPPILQHPIWAMA